MITFATPLFPTLIFPISPQTLVRRGADLDARDFKGRTPLHLAAELDRSETARFLIESGAPAGVADESGQTALAWMIVKMPPVAKEGE